LVGTKQQVALEEGMSADGARYTLTAYGRRWGKFYNGETGFDSPSVDAHFLDLFFLSFFFCFFFFSATECDSTIAEVELGERS
jgi:hypothetical protein